ncbi:hypothetical protein EDB59_2806 [Vibrio crassostreae]|nr:hypothetical protein EDB59_2806 [Vibrio crassostreae]
MTRITWENSDITIWGLQSNCVLCLLMFNRAYLLESVQPLVFRGFIIEVSRNE